ncbi:RES family NAD+ phosphorylase [Pedococcus sp. NPDC057267]|uniref:RES family NAD+ phosphorylase n=1 Tax=Pedococcus sp. NPDC057267 TaxID=3346077 RepID=UPI00363C193F
MADRQRPAQGRPSGSLEGFPTRRLTRATALFRAHRADRGPWWFGNDGGGRFDLAAPRGTCYLALDPCSAVRERLGLVLGGRREVPASLLEEVLVSTLHVPGPVEVADVQSREAGDFGVTRELESMVPYAVPQAWARAFDDAGLGGVAYGPRFTPGEASAVGLFGPAGAADWPVDPAPVEAVAVDGVPVSLAPPRLADITVVRAPRTRP